jgi:hypothetical protein
MTFAIAQLFINLIVITMVYIGVATLVGYLRAWIIDRLGDSTPAHMGYLTLNPIAHISVYSMLWIFLYIFRIVPTLFCWGKYIPFNSQAVRSHSGRGGILIAYLAETVIHILFAILGLIILQASFGQPMDQIIESMIRYGYLDHSLIANLFITRSSLAITLGFVGITFVYINTLLAFFSLVINSVGLIQALVLDRYNIANEYKIGWIAFAPIVIVVLLGSVLHNYVIRFLFKIAEKILKLFGY